MALPSNKIGELAYTNNKNSFMTPISSLRCLSMYFVVIIHTLDRGGLLAWVESTNSTINEVSYFIRILVCSCVDCFAIISGIVGYSSFTRNLNYEIINKRRIKKISKYWLNIWIYTAIISLLYLGTVLTGYAKFDINYLLFNTFPLTFDTYWYVSAYFVTLIWMPWLNLIVSKASLKNILTFLSIFGLGSAANALINGKDLFSINDGFSAVWLICLYLLGATLFKYKDKIKISPEHFMMLSIALTIAGWLIHWILGPTKQIFFKGSSPYPLYMSYISPITLGIAICLCCAAMQAKPYKSKKFTTIINSAGNAAFYVYIIHVNPFIWNYFVPKFTSFIVDKLIFVQLNNLTHSWEKALFGMIACLLIATLCYLLMLAFAMLIQHCVDNIGKIFKRNNKQKIKI